MTESLGPESWCFMGTVGEAEDGIWEDDLRFVCAVVFLMVVGAVVSLMIVCAVVFLMIVGSGLSVLLSLIFFLTHTDRLPLDANPMALASSSPLSPESLSALYFCTFSAMESGMSVSVSMSVLLPVFLKMSCGFSSSMYDFFLSSSLM